MHSSKISLSRRYKHSFNRASFPKRRRFSKFRQRGGYSL